MLIKSDFGSKMIHNVIRTYIIQYLESTSHLIVKDLHLTYNQVLIIPDGLKS